MKKRHPHKRSITPEVRADLRENNASWWRQRDKARIRKNKRPTDAWRKQLVADIAKDLKERRR